MNEEIKNQAIELSDEETENVSGGDSIAIGETICKFCNRKYSYKVYNGHVKVPPCPYCSETSRIL